VRRVRLGLLLSEIGQSNNVQITQAEMNQLIAREAVKYPSQQKEVVKYFQENQMAAAQLRAPLYEEKVVDYILTKITVTEKSVSKADIEAAIQDEGDIKAEAAEKPKTAKKAKSDEAPSKTEAA
jgi:trigger factor